jgi:chemotaxis protein CheZ
VQEGSKKLYVELGDLARFVEDAMRTISEVGKPLLSSNSELPQASAHLADLNKLTEEGTLEVMRLTEILQDNRSRAVKELAGIVETIEAVDCSSLARRVKKIGLDLAQDDKHLTEIMTALSFQDLVAQRVKKLVTILDDVHGKLMKLVVVFGIQQNGDSPADPGKASEMLKQLEATKTSSMKQTVANDILAQFGFK